jgi:hypothetical protein
MTEPTMRIVWYEGHAYPVSNSPPGKEGRGKYWYVLVEGDWQRLFACPSEAPSAGSWERIRDRVLEWLGKRERGDEPTA